MGQLRAVREDDPDSLYEIALATGHKGVASEIPEDASAQQSARPAYSAAS